MAIDWVVGQVTGDTAGARNNERRRNENKLFKKAKEKYRIDERANRSNYDFSKQQYDSNVENTEQNLRFQEKGLIQSYESQQEMRDFEYDSAYRAYESSRQMGNQQKNFNRMAEDAANLQQDIKLKEDLLGVLFDETETFLDYKANSTGLQMNKNNALAQADFQEAKNKAKYQFDLGTFDIERNKKRSESQIQTQKIILEGMKAAGAIRARGSGGRSSAKSALGVLAESGAMQANIANSLMYAEQGIDLGVAQLQDMFILDQTMVLAARDKANLDAEFGQAKLDSGYSLDGVKIKASRDSISNRNYIVRRQIENARRQADLTAEASVMLKPERMPDYKDPRELYAEYDNPETTDYVELFFRPEVAEFPDYVPLREPERDDFRGERENATLSNIMGGIGVAGMLAGGISMFGPGMELGTMTSAGGNFMGMSSQTWGTLGQSLYQSSGGYGR
tara:strand:+ start:51 stop:1400 length:1350 start_codon:yes stop_codon:yes gene_type:complete